MTWETIKFSGSMEHSNLKTNKYNFKTSDIGSTNFDKEFWKLWCFTLYRFVLCSMPIIFYMKSANCTVDFDWKEVVVSNVEYVRPVGTYSKLHQQGIKPSCGKSNVDFRCPCRWDEVLSRLLENSAICLFHMKNSYLNCKIAHMHVLYPCSVTNLSLFFRASYCVICRKLRISNCHKFKQPALGT